MWRCLKIDWLKFGRMPEIGNLRKCICSDKNMLCVLVSEVSEGVDVERFFPVFPIVLCFIFTCKPSSDIRDHHFYDIHFFCIFQNYDCIFPNKLCISKTMIAILNKRTKRRERNG